MELNTRVPACTPTRDEKSVAMYKGIRFDCGGKANIAMGNKKDSDNGSIRYHHTEVVASE